MNITLRKLEHVQFQDDTARSQQTEGGPSRPEVRRQLLIAPLDAALQLRMAPDRGASIQTNPDLSQVIRTENAFSRRGTRILELAHRVSRPRFKFQALPIYSYLHLVLTCNDIRYIV